MIQQLACVAVLSALALSPAQERTTGNIDVQDIPDAIRSGLFADSQPPADWNTGEEPFELALDYSGAWQLSWDDQIDGTYDDVGKACSLELKVVNGVISGKFLGPVEGTERNAIITGEVHGEYPALLTFIQREPGYSCSYQLWWAPSEKTPPTGTWIDSRGASGEFTLLRQQ